jgi:hypothetical protein
MHSKNQKAIRDSTQQNIHRRDAKYAEITSIFSLLVRGQQRKTKSTA